MKKSVKRILQRVKQFRLIGYIVIGISLWKLEQDLNSLLLKMVLLILFTELGSRGVSKSTLDSLREDIFIDEEHIIDYGDREKYRVKALHKQEKEDQQKVKEDIEKHYPTLK